MRTRLARIRSLEARYRTKLFRMSDEQLRVEYTRVVAPKPPERPDPAWERCQVLKKASLDPWSQPKPSR